MCGEPHKDEAHVYSVFDHSAWEEKRRQGVTYRQLLVTVHGTVVGRLWLVDLLGIELGFQFVVLLQVGCIQQNQGVTGRSENAVS